MDQKMEIKIDKIIRTKRKTIALQITEDANLIVRAPYDVSEQTIKNVVIKHKDWIEKKKKKDSFARSPICSQRVCKWRRLFIPWTVL
jgi:predicted metal-dependent hydrolase